MAYIYGLFYEDEGEELCFYIGKGKGYRHIQHLWESNLNSENPENEYKNRKIKKLKRNGYDPYARKLIEDLNEEKALKLEAEIINEIGLENLTNMTEGGSEPPTYTGKENPFYGKSHTEEFKKRQSEKMKKLVEQGELLSKEWRKEHSERMKDEGNPMYGKDREFSEEWKSKIGKATKERFKDPEERRKQAERSRGRTHSEETKEKMSKNRRGEKGSNAKLIKEEVKEIRWLLNNTDMLQKEIAKKYNTGSANISHINTGINWQHVTETKRPQ